MNARQAYEDWSRVRRVLRRTLAESEYLSVMASHLRLFPALQTGSPSIPRLGFLSINGSTPRIRWLYRCWRYGRLSIPVANAKLLAAGISLEGRA